MELISHERLSKLITNIITLLAPWKIILGLILKLIYYIDDKQWFEINYQNCSYDVISEEQLRYLDKQFEKYLSSCEVANLIANREAGYSTKEEFCLRLDDRYLEALM